MRLTQIEGDPREVAEYMKLTRAALAAGAVTRGSDEDDDAAGDAVAVTGELEVGSDLDDQDRAWLKQFIWSRGRDPKVTQFVEDYVVNVLEAESVTVESGTSTRTASGESNYLMVRDDGPRRFGAVVYVNPRGGRLNFRLLGQDVEDVKGRVTLRNIVKGQHHYRINLDLRSDEDVELAIDLTRRALAKVRE